MLKTENIQVRHLSIPFSPQSVSLHHPVLILESLSLCLPPRLQSGLVSVHEPLLVCLTNGRLIQPN